MLPGNTVQFSYTDSGNVTHNVTIVSLGQGGTLPLQTSPPNSNNQIVGVNFSGGMSSVVSQLNSLFGGNLQFANPSGTVLQVLNANAGGNTVTSLSATGRCSSTAGMSILTGQTS